MLNNTKQINCISLHYIPNIPEGYQCKESEICKENTIILYHSLIGLIKWIILTIIFLIIFIYYVIKENNLVNWIVLILTFIKGLVECYGILRHYKAISVKLACPCYIRIRNGIKGEKEEKN
jgi:hypothetical protein